MTRPYLSKMKKVVSELQSNSRYLVYSLSQPLLATSIFLNSTFGFGKNIFEEEWDLLIVLDTCRPDALRIVADEYEFINEVLEKWSVGGDSWEWMANTFDYQYIETISNTVYITSNPNSITVLENQFEKNHAYSDISRDKVKRLRKYGNFNLVTVDDFGGYQSLYEYGIAQKHGRYDPESMEVSNYPSPRTVTDHGIAADRNENFDRIILHYMPPHRPYIAVVPEDKSNQCNNQRIQVVDEPRDRTFSAYLDNLRWGLDEVRLVLNNMNREKVVITADHGTCISKYLPSHVSGSVNPTVRKVPWVVTTANDSKRYHPDGEINKSGYSPEEVLEALGYKI